MPSVNDQHFLVAVQHEQGGAELGHARVQRPVEQAETRSSSRRCAACTGSKRHLARST
jgi:hypothetical protein